MRRTATFVLVCVLGVSGPVPARQSGPQTQPTFRSGVELVQLDVSVLDRGRRPVRGLTAGDFTVLVDGRPEPVIAFKAIESPPALSPAWIRSVTPDIATNARVSGRLIAILIDDYSFSEAAVELAGIRKARETALAAVNDLGPEDLAAVVFTGYGRTAQTFTSDKQLLRNAIARAPLFGSDLTPDDSRSRGFCYCGVCSIDAIGRLAQTLRAVSDQRKLLVYVSAGSFIEIPTGKVDECVHRKRDALHAALREAHLANVTIYAVDPKGLVIQRGRASGRAGVPTTPGFGSPLQEAATMRQEFLRTLAESTGGRAVVNNNDMALAVPAILAESNTYYLLGVERAPVGKEGQLRRVQVRVNRPGVDVRTRQGYYDLTREERAATVQNAATGSAALAMTGVLPRSDIPLDVMTAPFDAPGRGSELAVVLRVRPPADGPSPDVVDVYTALFDPEQGNEVTSRSHRLSVDSSADAEARDYEVLSRLSVPPGRYELRVGLSTRDGRMASVYSSVEIPDFDDEDLSLSGLVLAAEPAGVSQPQGELRELLPIRPTARRTFRQSDRVTAFLRVYQRAGTPAPVTATASLIDANGVALGKDVQRLELGPAAIGSVAEFRSDLPLESLSAGEYVLTVHAQGGERSSERSLRFTVE